MLAQTHRNIEVLVVDDASQDNTLAVAQSMAEADDRIRVVRHAIRLGAQAARNSALAASGGKYVALLDSDDEWLPQKLQRQLDVFDKSGPTVGVVHAGYLEQTEDGAPPHVRPATARGNLYAALLLEYGLPLLTLLIRRDSLERAGGFDTRIRAWQEWDLCVKLARVTEFELVPDILAIYHLHSRPTISKSKVQSAWGYMDVAEAHADEIKRLHGPKVLSNRYLNAAYQFTAAGHLAGSRAALRMALQANPASFAAWRHLVATLAGAGAYKALRPEAKKK